MENALNKVDLRPYKRIVQMFWDPEPTNDTTVDLPVWCLGKSYHLGHRSDVKLTSSDVKPFPDEKTLVTSDQKRATSGEEHVSGLAGDETTAETSCDSTPSSFSSALAYEDPSQLGKWPQGFIDDFEARFWMTYRSDFVPIRRSADPKALQAMSLPMRLKTQFSGDHTMFTSDTGWGCMIRSGQSLLANALGLQWFGRGKYQSRRHVEVVPPLIQETDWRRGSRQEDEKKLIRLFADDPRAPFSLHKFVEKGASVCGKFPGEWFGPSATARCIK
jgi:cysteine protease ATG4